jgi:hypothetical protein
LVNHPELGPSREGLYRVVYRLESQGGAYAPSSFRPSRDAARLRPQQFRVPLCSPTAEEGLLFWTWFVQSFVDPQAPLLLLARLDQGWVDATLGEPTPEEFFCLQASRQRLPLTTEIPFNLTLEFRQRAQGWVESLVQRATAVYQEPETSEGATAVFRLTKTVKGWFSAPVRPRPPGGGE